MSLHLESPAFGQGERVPKKFTCEGENISPPLAWSGVPPEAEELLLVCDDPDAPGGVFHHWAMYNIPPGCDGLKEGFGIQSIVDGVHMAINDFGKPGYAGPCPPKGGGDHHYHFRLSALSSRIVSAGSSASCVEVMRLARPHVIEFVELIGVYRR